MQFSIQPKPGQAPKALLENYADIFFDYNPPVRTNTTINRLYDVPPQVVPAVQLAYAGLVASPSISSFAPAQGRAGTLVSIQGQRFEATAAHNQVFFNGVASPALSATATTLTVRVPAGAAAGKIQVVTTNGSARSTTDFVAFPLPTLATVAPGEGVPGEVITLTGTGFSPEASQDTVTFNGIAAAVRQATATTLAVAVPAGATTGLISLRTLGGQVASPQAFRVWQPPTITACSPAKAKAGTVLTITGTNFAEAAARNTVLLGPTPAPVLAATATQLQVRVPATAQTGPPTVRTPGGQATAAASFVFVPAPVVIDFAPRQGSVGTTLTISGMNFNADSQVDTIYVNGVAARVLRSSATQAVVQVPRGVRTGPLVVAGAGGRGPSSQDFVVLTLAPDEALAVYPNPTRGLVVLDWQRADFGVQEVRVYNALGKLVLQQALGAAATSAPLPLDAVGPGLYLVVVQTAQGPVTKRVAVQ